MSTNTDITSVIPWSAAEGGLTKDDIAAWRMANSLTLHLNPSAGSYIRLYCEGRWFHQDGAEPVKVFSAREQVLFPMDLVSSGRGREIPVTSTAYAYGQHASVSDVGGWTWGRQDPHHLAPSCFANVHRQLYILTIGRALRVGDQLRVAWMANNNSQNHNAVGYHADEVWLHATRATTENTWPMSHEVGPDNSARMIRRFA